MLTCLATCPLTRSCRAFTRLPTTTRRHARPRPPKPGPSRRINAPFGSPAAPRSRRRLCDAGPARYSSPTGPAERNSWRRSRNDGSSTTTGPAMADCPPQPSGGVNSVMSWSVVRRVPPTIRFDQFALGGFTARGSTPPTPRRGLRYRRSRRTLHVLTRFFSGRMDAPSATTPPREVGRNFYQLAAYFVPNRKGMHLGPSPRGEFVCSRRRARKHPLRKGEEPKPRLPAESIAPKRTLPKARRWMTCGHPFFARVRGHRWGRLMAAASSPVDDFARPFATTAPADALAKDSRPRFHLKHGSDCDALADYQGLGQNVRKRRTR